MLFGDDILRVDHSRRGFRWRRRNANTLFRDRILSRYRRTRPTNLMIRLEHIQSLQFLIKYGQWLEFLRLDHLLLEPIFDFVLLFLFDLFVHVI
jgi:hypothetical protein